MAPPSEVQLTVIPLSRPPVPVEQLAGLLSPDEGERASRFRFPELRDRFRTGRGMLRFLLGEFCQCAPECLQFDYSAHGKPSLLDHAEIHFNTSHSGNLWACAIGDTPLGLDIERIRHLQDYENIARRFFAPAEVASLSQIPENAREAAFFRCWTRKEAYVKARGEGLTRGLASFEVSTNKEEFSLVRDYRCPETWNIRTFVPAPGYTGAIATRSVAALLTQRG